MTAACCARVGALSWVQGGAGGREGGSRLLTQRVSLGRVPCARVVVVQDWRQAGRRGQDQHEGSSRVELRNREWNAMTQTVSLSERSDVIESRGRWGKSAGASFSKPETGRGVMQGGKQQRMHQHQQTATEKQRGAGRRCLHHAGGQLPFGLSPLLVDRPRRCS